MESGRELQGPFLIAKVFGNGYYTLSNEDGSVANSGAQVGESLLSKA
jgi:hypothetical protein